ncbi:response regulator transcription factor [Paenibacillus sp. YAF4_2]|uniref:response regulator transcription factor n=1 Tax=Paenibacillus sp. YAF4_2 TaxID=3233085 RepID=UPI003F989CBC
MYKVLVVDDEPFMLEGWKTMVNWEEHGFELCWAVSDGKEALDVMEHEVPDLVFTDLQMPVMDGLELIRQMKQHPELKDTTTVIVSGYSRFDAAQFAIKHQIEQYLLKPLIEEEIHELLDTLHLTLDERQVADHLAGEAESLSAVFVRALQDDEESRIALLRMMNCPAEAAGRLLLVDRTGGAPSPSKAEVEAILPEGFGCVEGAAGCVTMLVWSDQREAHSSQELDATVRMMAARLAEEWPSCLIYISGRTEGWRHLSQLNKQLLELRSRSMYKGQSGVYWYDGLHEQGQWRWEDAASRTAVLLRAVEQNDEAAIRGTAESLAVFIIGAVEPAGSLAASLSYLQGGLLRAYHKAGGNTEQPPEWLMLKYGRNDMQQAGDVTPLSERIAKTCLQAAEQIEDLNSKRPEGRLQEAVTFVTTHFRDKLQLKELAEQFRLNPVYLGQQFKRVTGYCFNDYVHLQRIKEAKKLLLRTDLKVSVIASELGYHSTEYFGSVFKSLTKVSPSAYKSNQKGDWRDDEPAVY